MRASLPVVLLTITLSITTAILSYLLVLLVSGVLTLDLLTFLVLLLLFVTVVLLSYFLLRLARISETHVGEEIPLHPDADLDNPTPSRPYPTAGESRILPPPLDVPTSPERSPLSPGEMPTRLDSGPADPQLQRQLVGMLAGDQREAERLVQQAKRNHPGRPENWYLQKVIGDLERDRR